MLPAVVREFAEMTAGVTDTGMLDGLVEGFAFGFLRDDARLQGALAALSRHLEAENGQLVLRDSATNAPLLRHIHGVPDDYSLLSSYDSQYCAKDPFLAPLRLAENAGRLFWQDLNEQPGDEASDFYDQYRRAGWRYMLSGSFGQREGRFGYVRFLRAAGAGPFDAGRATLLQQVLPHLALAWQMRDVFSQVYAALEPYLLQGNDQKVGVVHLDTAGRIVLANDNARRIFAGMDGLYQKDGAVIAGGWEETEGIKQLIEAVIAGARGKPTLPARNEITVARPSGRARYVVQAVPVIQRNRFTDENAIVAALRIIDQEDHDLHSSLHAYRLTAAESRLANYLIAGLPPKEVARQTGLSIHTIRTQQRGLYRKLGVSRHYELLMRLAPHRIK
jgi:DNA-binding CsgD family transcriptional regulator